MFYQYVFVVAIDNSIGFFIVKVIFDDAVSIILNIIFNVYPHDIDEFIGCTIVSIMDHAIANAISNVIANIIASNITNVIVNVIVNVIDNIIFNVIDHVIFNNVANNVLVVKIIAFSLFVLISMLLLLQLTVKL